MKVKAFILVLAASMLPVLTAQAHHSFGGTYDLKKQIKIEGTLIRVQFRNPHSFVTVKAPDETGAAQEWSIEWSGLPQLAGAGVNASTDYGRRSRRHHRQPVTHGWRASDADVDVPPHVRRFLVG